MESYYKGASDGIQLRDVDLLLGRGTSLSVEGIFTNLKNSKGLKEDNIKSLERSLDDTINVNDRLYLATEKFHSNLEEAKYINSNYGDRSAKGAIEMGNIFTRSLLDLNLLEILQRHSDMEFKTKRVKMAEIERKKMLTDFMDMDENLNKEIKSPHFSFDDPMRKQI